MGKLAYGNGDSVQYIYDKQGRVTKETYEDGSTVSYVYDNSGALATVTDSQSGITTTYYYDFIDRMMKYVESGTNYNHSVGYEYDTINNLTKLVETINGTEYTTSYTYDKDNRVTTVNANGKTVTYTYDAYGRVSKQVTKNGSTTILTEHFTYRAPTSSTTTGQIATYRTVSAGYDVTYTYTYDDNGNILSISDGTNTTSYVYDTANQLVRENNQAKNYTHTWTYDDAGNILDRKEYAYTTSTLGAVVDTISYTYGNTDWGDLLTAYDGQAITYDTIGNPLSDGTYTYTWKHGRQLESIERGSTTYQFAYNADGLRTKCTYGNSTRAYYYNGTQLTRMTVNDTVLDFTYDASGTPLTITRDGEVYYYVTNLQGDVTDILDSSGNMVGSYTYTAWGVCDLSGNDSIAQDNPLRYRGYVYDDFTGLYYLQSRYYNPETGRFINADGLVSTGQGLLGNNMFAYCNNNSVTKCDPNGFWTMGLSIGANVTVIFGVSISIGIFWDDKGNAEWQWSYAVPGVDNTNVVGILDVGVGGSFQYTNRDSVYDLYGPATSIGASGGPSWYVGGDIISFADASDSNSSIDGFQITGGVGIGLDVHVVESYTKPVVRSASRLYDILTFKEKRLGKL